MSSVPEDIYPEILAKLSVKSIYVCKCVCKSWFQIISNPNFVQMHLNHAKQRNNTSLMYTAYDPTTSCRAIFTIAYDSISCCEIDDANCIRKHHPFGSESVELEGYCNGLVYIWTHSTEVSCIWNPATREYKTVPKSPDLCVSVGYYYGYSMWNDVHMCGFGYDCKINDYKVVIIAKTGRGSEFHVYTLGKNSWISSYAADLDMVLIQKRSGVLVNGALHWVGRKIGEESQLIISLDISVEKFKEFKPPKEINVDDGTLFCVGALEGLLSAFVVIEDDRFDIWVMQNYGVQESWTKRCIITTEDFVLRNNSLTSMWSSNKGEVLLWNGYTLVLYDPKYESTRVFSRNLIDSLNAVMNYFESLVSVDSGTYVVMNQEEDSD